MSARARRLLGVLVVLYGCEPADGEAPATSGMALDLGVGTPCRGEVAVNQCGRWNGVELTAFKDYAADLKEGDERCVCRAIAWKIPSVVPTTAGSPWNHQAKLTFVDADTGKVEHCRFRGAKHQNGNNQAPPGTDLDYHFDTCTDGGQPGELRRSRYFRFSIDGDPSEGRTESVLALGERRFRSSDPLLAKYALRVPMDAAPDGQRFTLGLNPLILPGIYVPSPEGGGKVAAAYGIDVEAVGFADHYEFAPGMYAELDIEYDPSALFEPRTPYDLFAGTFEIVSETEANVTPAEGERFVDTDEHVVTTRITHLSPWSLFVWPSQIGIKATISYREQNEVNPLSPDGNRRKVRNALAELWMNARGIGGRYDWRRVSSAVTFDDNGPFQGMIEEPGEVGLVGDWPGAAARYEVVVYSGGNGLSVGPSSAPFFFQTPEASAFSFSSGGSTINPAIDIDDPAAARYFNVFETLQRGLEYVTFVRDPADLHQTVPGLHVIVAGESSYDGAVPNVLRIAEGEAFDDHRVLHVLGHAVEHYLADSVQGRRFADTGFDPCAAPADPESGWLDGFADYFAFVARYSLRNRHPELFDPGTDLSIDPFGVPYQWEGEPYFSRGKNADFRRYCPDAGLAGPQAMPEYVASTLFDLYDTQTERDLAGTQWDEDSAGDATTDGITIFQIFDNELDHGRIGVTPVLSRFRDAWVNSRGQPGRPSIFLHDAVVPASPDDAVIADADAALPGALASSVAPFEVTVPAQVVVGRPFEVRITLENVGSNAWDGTYELGTNNAPAWGDDPVTVKNTVLSGERVTFAFSLTPACSASVETFHWQMRRGGSRFGQIVQAAVEVQPFTDGDGVCDNACGENSANSDDCADAEWRGLSHMFQVESCTSSCPFAPWLGEDYGCTTDCNRTRPQRSVDCFNDAAEGEEDHFTCLACTGYTVHWTANFKNTGTLSWFQQSSGMLGVDDTLHTPHAWSSSSTKPLYPIWSSETAQYIVPFASVPPGVYGTGDTFSVDDDFTLNEAYGFPTWGGCLRYGVGHPNYTGGEFDPILFGLSPQYCLFFLPCSP